VRRQDRNAARRSLDRGQLRTLVDNLKQKLGEGVVVLGSAQPEGKVAIIAGVTPGLIKRIQAGKLVGAVAKLVGGSGGGKPEIAEAGGKDQAQLGAVSHPSRPNPNAGQRPGEGGRPDLLFHRKVPFTGGEPLTACIAWIAGGAVESNQQGSHCSGIAPRCEPGAGDRDADAHLA
jgi:hypothetical protein